MRHDGLRHPYGMKRRLFNLLTYLFALTAILPAAWMIARNRCLARVEAGLCPSCGYDLRATPGRCPDCGAGSD